jgi:AraC-like DNA-binding protein
MNVPDKYYKTRIVTRLVGGNTADHELHCGFLLKNKSQRKERNYEFYSAVLVLEGNGTYEDALGRKYKIGPGDLIQRLPRVAHTSAINKGTWLECYIVFGRQLFEFLAELGLVNDQTPILHVGVDLGLIKRFHAFQEQLRQAKDSELFHCLIAAQSLLAFMYDQARPGETRDHILSEQACHLLSQRLDERCGSDEILAEMGVGYERIRKIFKTQVGISPHAYRIRRRLDRACELLHGESLSISEIATQLGYADPFTFSRQFTKERGTSPSAYRKQV